MQPSIGPRWAKSRYPQIAGEDHLGIKYVSVLIADRLQSSITTITPRARYWSFFTWVLNDFIQNSQDRSSQSWKNYLKRQEWFYILANIAEAEDKGIPTRQVMGVNKGLDAWAKGDLNIPCRFDYLKSSFGGYSIYRNVIRNLGLIQEGDIEKGVEIDRITPKGLELAEAFSDEIKDTEYFKHYRQGRDPVPRPVLLEFGKKSGLCSISPGSRDLQLLKNMFIPADSEEEHHRLRSQSLHYYKLIISKKSFNPNISAATKCLAATSAKPKQES